jgi:hypothetical protein
MAITTANNIKCSTPCRVVSWRINISSHERKFYDLMWRNTCICNFMFRNLSASWVGTVEFALRWSGVRFPSSRVGAIQFHIKWVYKTQMGSTQNQTSGPYVGVGMFWQSWQINERIYTKIMLDTKSEVQLAFATPYPTRTVQPQAAA